ncbi:MAG: glycosyltransferase [Marinilabiliaceae bacterium]|nr:glycosyltransferase [Marinilabiliaceae bacterium]
MKILISTDPEIPVPPALYGGAERVAYGLIKGLKKEGHEIILLANKASKAPEVDKLIGWKKELSIGFWNILINAFQLFKVIKQEKPDVVYCYSRILYLYPSWLLTRKVFFKRYGRFISPKSTALANTLIGKRIIYTANGRHMINHLPDQQKWHIIHNMVDTDLFKDDPGRIKNYLFFLGRIEHIKGTKEAIEAALAANEKLVIAGNIPPEHQSYFDQYVKPHLSNPLFKYIGPVNDEEKIKWLQGAKGMLLPLNLAVEAFPNTMIESLACGTPVIGFNISAVPEAVTNQLNGYVVKNVEEMTAAIKKLDSIDRQKVREDAIKRFSIPVITQQHISLFQKYLYK